MKFDIDGKFMNDIRELSEKIAQEAVMIENIIAETSKVIAGQNDIIEKIIIGLLSGGHLLLEGVPGLAKTLVIKTIASTINAGFQRIQFTPDLLPADLLGTLIYSQRNEEFIVKKGPIFSNFILADEINRSPAKVQSALLEAMQEKQVTIGEETFVLQEPFLVLATQNPIEQEGTYPLPEAQVDRFIMKLIVNYPSKQDERIILRRNILKEFPKAETIINPQDILKARTLVKDIYMDEKIENYILDIVFATRFPKEYGLGSLEHLINYGASPRATINLAIASKALAFIRKRGFVIPEDIKSIIFDVLRHRIGLTYEAEAENIKPEDVITTILNKIEVP